MGVLGKCIIFLVDVIFVGIFENGNELGIKLEMCNWGLFNVSFVIFVGLSCVKLLGSFCLSFNL